MYSFGASITHESSRATKLSLYDGVEQLSLVVSVSLSPIMLEATGYLGRESSQKRADIDKRYL